MRNLAIVSLSAAMALVAAGPLSAQYLHDVGTGPSTTFLNNLPTSDINRTLGLTGGFTTSGRFFNRPPPGGSYLAAPGVEISLQRGGWSPVGARDLSPGPGFGPLVGLKFRTIDSLNFEKRGRFAKLRETTLALAEHIREADKASLGQVSIGFRQFMFPLPLVDSKNLGYGFFSRLDLVGTTSISPDAFLAPFTEEVQQSLGDKRFLDATQALLLNRPLPEGMQIDQFYDTQLSALANFLFNNGRYEAAGRAWGLLAERDPTNAIASRGLALCLIATGQARKAAAEVRRSFTLMPGWPEKVRIVGSNLQDVFPNAKDLVGVREELQAQLARQSDDPDLNLLMACVDLLHGNLPAAGDRLGKLAEKDPVARGLAALIKSGAVADTVKRPAQSALRRAAEEMTGLEEPALSPEARARLVAVLKGASATFDDYMRLGDFRFFMGDFTQAAESYRAAHNLKPEDAFALFAMTHAAYANGEYKQAARYLEQALALQPNWGLYEFRIQEFYGDQDEYTRHLKDLERQVQLRPRAADAKFLLAYIYYFSGRYADATDLLADVLRLDPKFEKADYFLRLARLQG